MNIAELTSQLYNLACVGTSQSKMKRKSKKYFRQLAHIKSQMSEANIIDPSVESLTSLLYAFNRNILHLKLYGHDPKYRKSLIDNTRSIEYEIRVNIQECNHVLIRNRNFIYRNSI